MFQYQSPSVFNFQLIFNWFSSRFYCTFGQCVDPYFVERSLSRYNTISVLFKSKPTLPGRYYVFTVFCLIYTFIYQILYTGSSSMFNIGCFCFGLLCLWKHHNLHDTKLFVPWQFCWLCIKDITPLYRHLCHWSTVEALQCSSGNEIEITNASIKLKSIKTEQKQWTIGTNYGLNQYQIRPACFVLNYLINRHKFCPGSKHNFLDCYVHLDSWFCFPSNVQSQIIIVIIFFIIVL